MAPREVPKAVTKVQRIVSKTLSTQRTRSPAATVKKSVYNKIAADKVLKAVKDTNILQSRRRTSSVPIPATPKKQDKKIAQTPGTVCKSAKKENWKRRPKPAHSGVPVPEKMRKLQEKQLLDADCSL